MYKVPFEFSLGQRVKIIELGLRGRVIELCLCDAGRKYLVRYFQDAMALTEDFYEDELTQI